MGKFNFIEMLSARDWLCDGKVCKGNSCKFRTFQPIDRSRQAASRAYYAAFYAATAVLLSGGFEFKKHSGVIAAIHQKFVKTGKLDKRHGKNLNWLFELRDIGDYGVTLHIQKQEAENAIEAAKAFLQAVNNLIKDS